MLVKSVRLGAPLAPFLLTFGVLISPIIFFPAVQAVSDGARGRAPILGSREMKKIDLDGALLWLGFGRGVCVVGSGDFAAVSWFSFRSGVLQQRQKNHETAELAIINTRTRPPKPSQSRATRFALRFFFIFFAFLHYIQSESLLR